MLAIELDDEELAQELVKKSLEKGLILFFFLFTKTAIRITPPLTISEQEIIKVEIKRTNDFFIIKY